MQLWSINLMFRYFLLQNQTDPSTELIEISKTVEFLKQGDSEIQISNEFHDLVLVLGNQGSGKSTLTLFTGGNLADLTSIEDPDNGYLIESDAYNWISHESPGTIYPNLIIDENNVAFYDCPSYNTKSMSIEIAGKFFLKKVIDHSYSLKLVLTVDYQSVKPGSSNANFHELVKNVYVFAHGSDKYKYGVSFIATKVDENETDLTIIDGIANFLQSYRDYLSSESDNQFHDFAMGLVDIFLQKNGKTYDKIGLFRKPDSSGPLNQMKFMVEDRRKLRDLILNRTEYVKKDDDDFQFTLTSASHAKLISLVAKLNEEITKNVQEIGKVIEFELQNEVSHFSNFIKLKRRFEDVNMHMGSIGATDAHNMNADSIVASLSAVVKEINMAISIELFENIPHLESYIRFLQFFSDDDKLKPTPSDWLEGLTDCKNYLDRSRHWYRFLSDFYEKYSSYDYRQDLDKYNVADINDWGQLGKKQGIYITQNNFWQFMEKQQNIAIPHHEIPPNDFQLQMLNDILQITFKDRVEIVCDKVNAKMTVRGHYVQLSEFNANYCHFPLKLLYIFASHTVFLDADFTTNNTDVIIVAPKWSVVGKTNILLTGLPGKHHSAPAESAKRYKLTREGIQGKSGKMGLPGNAAFNFLGVGSQFVNGVQLNVSSIGGRGGGGQTGGAGTDAVDPDPSLLKGKIPGKDLACRANLRSKQYLKTSDGYIHCDKADAFTEECTTEYLIYGACAGRSGDGGLGGHGGNPGIVRIFELAAKSNITKVTRVGNRGFDGDDGPSPRSGTVIGMSCYIYRSYVTGFGNDVWTQGRRSKDDKCPTYLKKKSRLDEIQPKQSPFFDPSIHLGEYLGFARESQLSNLKRDDILNFVNILNNDVTILSNYSLNGFVNELLILEGQYYLLKEKVDLENYYFWLASKIENFVARWRPTSQEQLKVFGYLYTAAWGKYLSLKAAPFLITDIKSYLDSSIHIIQSVEKSKRGQIIDNFRTQYKYQIMSKIDDVNLLIENDIIPKIQLIRKELQANIEALIDETMEMKNKVEISIEKYKNQQKKLSKEIAACIAFGVLDVLSVVVSCLGPCGMAAGLVISGVSHIGGILTQTSSSAQAFVNIPDGVKKVVQGAQNILNLRREAKLNSLKKQIELIERSASEEPDVFQDTLEKIDDLRKKLKQMNLNGTNAFEEMNAAEMNLKELIEKKRSVIEENPSKYGEKALKVINVINHGLTVAQASAHVYEKHENGQKQLDEIGKALRESTVNLQKLQEFERSIYKDVWPMLTDMFTEINEIAQGESKSHASIDLKKFKIQSWLRDTKYRMHTLVKDFEMEEDLMHTFHKFDDVYVTLMNVYDRLESYQDQTKFSDYIADIASTAVENIKVTDPQLNSVLRRLDVVIDSNVLLNAYKAATDEFTHTVFPFGSYYFDAFKLPTNLQTDDFPTIVTQASKQLDALKEKHQLYNDAIINENDQFIVKASFLYGVASSQPFYIFRFENYRSAITDLLSGKIVKIHADIKQGVVHNAIKFNHIKLIYENKNPSLQAKLQKKLLNFDVTMTHMGNSYYRCGSSYYVIQSPATTIMYSNEEANGVPLRYNNVYNKLLQGDILLSPYAMWRIQLEYHAMGSGKEEFEVLKKLAKGTDMLLVGRGLYVRNDAPVCQRKAEYYSNFEFDNIVT